jgi:hypothetical protein
VLALATMLRAQQRGRARQFGCNAFDKNALRYQPRSNLRTFDTFARNYRCTMDNLLAASS